MIDQLLFQGLLVEEPNDGKPILQLGDPDGVRAVYRGEQAVRTRRAPEGLDSSTRSGNPRRRGRSAPAEALSPELRERFERLRAWRRDRAAEQKAPPYVIFQDRTLLEIASRRPSSLDALARIPGVGQAKLQRYGQGVLEALSEG